MPGTKEISAGKIKYIVPFLILFSLSLSISFCKKKTEPNKVDIDQVEMDGSSNDKYIFREEIEKEKWKEKRYKKKKF